MDDFRLDDFLPIIDRCTGCGNIMGQPPLLEVPAVNKCRVFINPEAKWSAGNCVMATHLKKKVEMEAKALDPIKASKRKMKGK